MTRHLDQMGVLGPRFSAAHAIWIDADEIDLIAQRGGAIAHNPGSNLRLGNGIADMRPVIARGIPVGVGTDGSASADNQNMFEAMRLAAFVSRVFDRPPDDVDRRDRGVAAGDRGQRRGARHGGSDRTDRARI